MGESLETVEANIRACIISNKGPTPLRSLARDYDTLIGGQIPYREFNYSSLEEFLRSFRSLRVLGSGRDAEVQAATISTSSHITELVSRQKSSKKPASVPPRRSYNPSYRGRGRGGRARGYAPRYNPAPRESYPPKDYQPQQHYAAAREQPTRDTNGYHDRGGGDYENNSLPRRQSPNMHNRQDAGPITVKVDADDKRQVSWKKSEQPPRFQRLRQQQNAARMFGSAVAAAQMNADIPPVSPGAQGFDSTDHSTAESASIISAFSPSQLIERERKRQAEKAKLEQQSAGNQEAIDLTASMFELSNQIPGAMSLASQNQVPEDLHRLAAAPTESLIPEPDEINLANNCSILHRYCLSRGWSPPTYNALSRLDPDSRHRKTIYLASVKVNGTDTYSSMPLEDQNVELVKGYAAKKALEAIILKAEAMKVKADKVISSNRSIICTRISDIVGGATSGLFAQSVEDSYIKQYNELLPGNWLEIIGREPHLSVEDANNQTIIVSRDPLLAAPPLDLPTQFDTTIAPPPLDVDVLGDAEGLVDLYVTHATSVNNVWFRVIGSDHSDAYENLLTQIDIYYKGEGAKEQALSVEVGKYYAAHDSEFNTWFRVCAREVDNDSQMVIAWLVDHGDTVLFPFSSLYRLAPRFCQLPRQAVLCVLDGLEVLSDDEVANEVVSRLLVGKSLIAVVSSKDKESVSVKAVLYDTSGVDDINMNDSVMDETMSRSKPELPPEGCAMEVAIGDVSKKGEIFIMFNGPWLERVAETVDSLGPDTINEHKVTSFKSIFVNNMYLAKYSKDETWYRAVVISPPSVQHDKIPVRFIDYGNTESVSIKDVADMEKLPKILKMLPPQAMKVALNSLPLESLSNSDVARLHSLLMDEEKSVLVKTISLISEPPVVEIFTKEAENSPLVSINNTIALERSLLLSRNEDKKSPFAFPNQAANLNQTKTQDDFDLKCPDLECNDECQYFLVVLAAHPGNFIFQPAKYGNDLKKLRIRMCAYYDVDTLQAPHPERITRNKLFAARYSDENWYRVVVTDSPMGSRVPVRLCDFGDVTCVSMSDLRELAPEFHAYPFMAVKGKLAGVKPIHTDWSVDDCIRFQTLVVDHILAGFIVNIKHNTENPMEMVVTLTLIDTSSDEDQIIGNILLQENRALREI